MARSPRADVFSPTEIAIAHITQRCVRGSFLMGHDPVSKKCYDHRKVWIEQRLKWFSAYFAIDLICFTILSNHFHLPMRSRPDLVATWDDLEVARRWLMICPSRRDVNGEPLPPTEARLNKIRNNPALVAKLRLRLSDFSWWMRLLSQPLAAMANREDDQQGHFWQARFHAVRVCDEASLVACAMYDDLNPIRAAMAERLEASDFTSVQRRIESLQQQEDGASALRPDRFLAPVQIDANQNASDSLPSKTPYRASDKGFLSMSTIAYLELLDWTARQVVPSKAGATPSETPPVLERLGLNVAEWIGMVTNFGRLYSKFAGLPETLANQRSSRTDRPFHTRREFRALFSSRAA